MLHNNASVTQKTGPRVQPKAAVSARLRPSEPVWRREGLWPSKVANANFTEQLAVRLANSKGTSNSVIASNWLKEKF
jgi:hypothetical protein